MMKNKNNTFSTIYNQLIVANGAEYLGGNYTLSQYKTTDLYIEVQKYKNGRIKSITIAPYKTKKEKHYEQTNSMEY